MRRLLAFTAVLVAAVFVIVMQYHQRPSNLRLIYPDATLDARLHPAPEVQRMLHQSCYDCHSEEGNWPWYSHFWPGSKLLEMDVHEGRARLDFSEWDRLSPEMSKIRLMDACRMMTENKMPVWYYRPMHPMTSTPDPATVAEFCQWAKAMPGESETPPVQ
jgi:hypothetical protein